MGSAVPDPLGSPSRVGVRVAALGCRHDSVARDHSMRDATGHAPWYVADPTVSGGVCLWVRCCAGSASVFGVRSMRPGMVGTWVVGCVGGVSLRRWCRRVWVGVADRRAGGLGRPVGVQPVTASEPVPRWVGAALAGVPVGGFGPACVSACACSVPLVGCADGLFDLSAFLLGGVHRKPSISLRSAAT